MKEYCAVCLKPKSVCGHTEAATITKDDLPFIVGSYLRYIECPALDTEMVGKPSVFLAGGITNCPDWQTYVTMQLLTEDITVFNPRRENFPIDDPEASFDQIKWEYDHLRKADMLLFWFPSETLCPIVLFELGAWSRSNKPMFIGVHPAYRRKQDVEIQMGLARPEVPIVYSLDDLVAEVKKTYKAISMDSCC